MAERDFYMLASFSVSDMEFMEKWLRTNESPLQESHRWLFQRLAYVAAANELIQISSQTSPEEKVFARALVIEIEEKLHSVIERESMPFLSELRKKRTDFLRDDENAIVFFHFLGHQYFRTKRIRNAIGDALSDLQPDQDFGRLRNVLCYCFATNLGASLFADRSGFDLVFLTDSTNLGFITGDQPVVNIMGTANDIAPEELALYYPRTPSVSLLLSPREYELCSTSVPKEIVEELNEWIVWSSSEFLVANSKSLLQKIAMQPAPQGPPTRRVLDYARRS